MRAGGPCTDQGMTSHRSTDRRSVGHKILPFFTLTSGYRPGIPNSRTSPKCLDSSNHKVWASMAVFIAPGIACLLRHLRRRAKIRAARTIVADNLLCYRRHRSAPFRINGTSFLGIFVFIHVYLKEPCNQTMFHARGDTS